MSSFCLHFWRILFKISKLAIIVFQEFKDIFLCLWLPSFHWEVTCQSDCCSFKDNVSFSTAAFKILSLSPVFSSFTTCLDVVCIYSFRGFAELLESMVWYLLSVLDIYGHYFFKDWFWLNFLSPPGTLIAHMLIFPSFLIGFLSFLFYILHHFSPLYFSLDIP